MKDYKITLKSGMEFDTKAKSKKEAISNLVKFYRDKDIEHAKKNNFEYKERDYSTMVLIIRDTTPINASDFFMKKIKKGW